MIATEGRRWVTSDPGGSADSSQDVAWVIALGVLVAVSMISLSLTGLLGRLTYGSVAACLLVASVAGLLYAARSGFRIQGLPWMAFPLLAPPALAAWFLPPYTWDEVAYGAALPRDFARAGRFFYNADYGPYSAFPGNYEALVTASLLLTGDVRWSQLLNVVLAIGMGATSVRFARALGASRAASLLGGLFVLCAPVVIQVAPRTKNDVANALLQVLALLVLVECLETPGYSAAILSGVFLGASLGTKYSSLHFVLATAPFTVLLLARSADSRRSGLARVLAWAGTTALIASPWYLRNLFLFGNPVFPFMNDALGIHSRFTPQHSVLMREAIDSLTNFSFKTGSTTTFAARMTKGLGILPVVLMWPGALLAWRRPPCRAGVLLTGTAITYTGVTLLVGYWEPRYVLSLLVIASALAAVALTPLEKAVRRIRLAPPRLVAGVALLFPAAVAISGAYPLWRNQLQNVAAIRQEGRQAFIEKRVAHLAVASWLNNYMGPDDKVAIGFNVQPFYYLERPYYHIHPLTEGDLLAAQAPDEVEASLRRVGATLLAFSESERGPLKDAPMNSAYRERLGRAVRELRKTGRLRPLARIKGVRIFQLEDERTPAGSIAPSEPRDR